MEILYELVTVNREHGASMSLSDWEGGSNVWICKSGDLPVEESREHVSLRPRVIGRK